MHQYSKAYAFSSTGGVQLTQCGKGDMSWPGLPQRACKDTQKKKRTIEVLSYGSMPGITASLTRQLCLVVLV